MGTIWRVVDNDESHEEYTWRDVKETLGDDGGLDILTKQLNYIAVSVAQG